MTPMNRIPIDKVVFTHTARNGIRLESDRLNLSGENHIIFPKWLSQTDSFALAEAITDIIGWWAVNIYPTLSSFSGFDSVEYHIGSD